MAVGCAARCIVELYAHLVDVVDGCVPRVHARELLGNAEQGEKLEADVGPALVDGRDEGEEEDWVVFWAAG